MIHKKKMLSQLPFSCAFRRRCWFLSFFFNRELFPLPLLPSNDEGKRETFSCFFAIFSLSSFLINCFVINDVAVFVVVVVGAACCVCSNEHFAHHPKTYFSLVFLFAQNENFHVFRRVETEIKKFHKVIWEGGEGEMGFLKILDSPL